MIEQKEIIDHRSSIFDYNPTTRVVFGENTITQLGKLTNELSGKRVLLITDDGLRKTGHVDKALEALKGESIECAIFQEVEENPTTQHVEKGVQFARENSPIDVIIGLGGGSAMDCAKGINFILTNGGKMADYWGVGKATKPMLPSIGIPTTAGTGSEAQSFALIAKEDSHQKMACGDKKASFRVVILDPTLLASVPRKVAAVTGLDAISHAIESYVSTKRNPLSQMYSREAWRLLSANYEKSLDNPDDLQALGNMQLGAHWAGAAIENSMLGAAHACANPLTANFDITHGIAVGLMLPHIIRFNSRTVNGDYKDLAEIAGLQAGSGAVSLAKQITRLTEKNDLPVKLAECNINESALEGLAREAAQQWTGKFNPRPVGEAELLELYKNAM
ncbi:MAG: iron-containing alcohol dehydrogenase [bacterium]